jgi:hypothetical protein
MRLMQKSRARRALALPRRAWVGARTQVKKRVDWLKKRYGRGYATALFVVAVVAFFSPLPGTTLVGIALVVSVAEIHRAVSRGRRNREATSRKEQAVMSISCDLIVDRKATSAQLTALGSALWAWCSGTLPRPGIYQCLDSQVLADLIAGKLPTTGQSPAQSEQKADGIHFRIHDEESPDRQAAVAALRRDIPSEGLIDILVAGLSWNQDGAGVLPSLAG